MPGYQPRHDVDRVWYNGHQINSTDVTESGGGGVLITAIYGWDDRPDVRDVREPRPAQMGEYVGTSYVGGRTITIEGEIYYHSWVGLQNLKRWLANAFAPTPDEVLLKVSLHTASAPTHVYAETGMVDYERVQCRVIEAIQFGASLDPMCQTFQVVLRASDPRVYLDVETSTDSGTSGTSARTVTVDGGDFPTPPTLTVTGPIGSAWDIAEPTSGLNLDFSGVTLGSGATVAIDVKERTAYLTASYEQVRTSYDSLVALWMLDETSGTTADNQEGTAALDGTYTGGYTLNQSGPKSGVASVDLNGTTGYISLTTNASMDVQESTWEGWIYLDTLASTNKIIIDHMGGSSDGYKLMAHYSTQQMLLEIGVGGASFYQFLVNTTLTTGTWIHLAVVTTASSVAVYRDGVRVNLTSAPGGYSNLQPGYEYSPPAASTAMTFGRSSNGASRYLDGKIAGYAFYDTNFDAGTIQALYEATNDTGNVFSVYPQLDAATSRWEDLGTVSSTYTLSSSGLNTGSKLNVAFREARL